jgi:hypothetical protein
MERLAPHWNTWTESPILSIQSIVRKLSTDANLMHGLKPKGAMEVMPPTFSTLRFNPRQLPIRAFSDGYDTRVTCSMTHTYQSAITSTIFWTSSRCCGHFYSYFFWVYSWIHPRKASGFNSLWRNFSCRSTWAAVDRISQNATSCVFRLLVSCIRNAR